MEVLCQQYWYPLYCYARRSGKAPTDAEDLTQEFFARLLAKRYLDAARQEKGRLRTFLLTAFKRFLANEWDRELAQKGGSGMRPLSMDTDWAEERLSREPANTVTPDLLYDQQWALNLLEKVVEALQHEYERRGKGPLFASLKGSITVGGQEQNYQAIGQQLGLNEGAVKVAVFRLRKQYRELLREQIAATVDSDADIDAEIRNLFSVFSS